MNSDPVESPVGQILSMESSYLACEAENLATGRAVAAEALGTAVINAAAIKFWFCRPNDMASQL